MQKQKTDNNNPITLQTSQNHNLIKIQKKKNI